MILTLPACKGFAPVHSPASPVESGQLVHTLQWCLQKIFMSKETKTLAKIPAYSADSIVPCL